MHHGLGNSIRFPEAAIGNAVDDLLVHLITVGIGNVELVVKRRISRAGTDGIGANAVRRDLFPGGKGAGAKREDPEEEAGMGCASQSMP
ncbi:hypothetical protein GCM10010872_35620 [Dyella flava]|nr:hypothetical protein GCM10010872_35620 [Dyella flava]